jgi:serine/threonine-protein kinase
MADEFAGRTIADKYRLDSPIVRGDRGDLYSATHILMDKPVSVRVLPRARAADDALVYRFFSAVKAASQITHPNILNITDFGTDQNGVVYAVCDAVKGETLAGRIRREGKLSVDQAIEITKQVASALSASSTAGVTHGNLTPNHILISEVDETAAVVKVLDFSSRNPLDRTEDINNLSASDFAYVSPELCAGAEGADTRSDIYALGVITYEMLAGEPPFTGEKPSDVMMKHTEEPPSPLVAFRGDLPAGIEAVIIKAMAKDPDLRYQTAQEFLDDLETVSSGQSAAAGAGGGSFWRTAFIALIGIGILATVLIYATSVKRTNPTTQLVPDANGQPVQPINPATGVEEQNLIGMGIMSPEMLSNTNTAQAPGTIPGGDGYNPWATGAPPPGGPPLAPGGQVMTVPGGQSPFMADANCILQPSGILLCPVPVTPTPTPKNTPTPKATPAADANTTTPVSTPTPRATPSRTPASTPAPAKTPEADIPNSN